MNNPNLITEDKSLLSILEELSPFLESIKESMRTIQVLEEKVPLVINHRYYKMTTEQDINSLKLAQVKVSEAKETIDYLIENFPGFPDTFIEEEEDPYMDYRKDYGRDDMGDIL